jgi:cation transport regulator ChaC
MSLEPGTLYFAYGCNMDRDHLAAVVGRSVAAGYAARLQDHRIAFDVPHEDGSRFADILPAPGGAVYGVVFRLAGDALRTLDGYEGVPELYRRAALWVEPIGRRARQAVQVYVGRQDHRVKEGAPDAEYLGRLVRGALRHGLPEDYVNWVRVRAAGRGDPLYRAAEP